MMSAIRWPMIGMLVTGLLAPGPAPAAEPATKCEADKLKIAGVYATCRLKADAKARTKGVPPDYTSCDQTFAKKFGNTEAKAGPGVCPTEGDLAAIGDEVAAGTTEVAGQLGAPDPACPAGYLDRSYDQVAQDWLAAFAAGDEAALTCNYHPSAYMIDDQGVTVGRGEVVSTLMSLRNLMGVGYDLWEDIYFSFAGTDTVRLLYEMDGGWVVIPDGVDTMIVKRGQIRVHTRHSLIEFTGPPPE